MKQVSITKAVKIKNQRVKSFDGEKEYLATGGLIEGTVKTELVTFKTKPSRADLLVTEKQIIVARMKETNKVLLIDNKTSGLIVSTGFLVLDVQDGWDPGFLFHYFLSGFFQEQKDRLSIGATQKAINNEKFREIRIPELSLEDQIHIAKVLDHTDALRQKRKQAIGLLDDYLKSVFLEMFGDPLKNTKGWMKTTLQKITKKITDGTHQSPKFEESGIPFIFISNIKDNKICLKTRKFISEKTYTTLTKSTPIEKHDILYTIVGSYGNPAIVETDELFCFQRHIAHIKPDCDKTNIYFLYGLLNSPYIKKQADIKAKGVAQKTLNLSELKNFNIILPPMSIQTEYAEIVQKTESVKQSMLAQSAELEIQFQALMQKAFRGEL